jgi:HK97 family phage portal protein
VAVAPAHRSGLARLFPFRRGVKATAGRGDLNGSVLSFSREPEWPSDNYDRYATDYYGRDSLVFACIQEIATSAAEARLYPADLTDPNNPEEVTEDDGGELADVAHLLAHPNPRQDQFEFMEEHHTHLQVAGNAFVFKLRDGSGKPAEIYNLRPNRIHILPKDARGPAGYVYRLEYDGQAIPVAADDIIHIKRQKPWGGDYEGMSPLHVLMRNVSLSQAIIGFKKAFFDNGGVPQGILKLKRQVLDDDEPERLRGQWRSRFGSGAGGGFENWGRLAVLDSDADYQNVQMDLDKMALPTLEGGNELSILRAFGVPGILVQARLAIEHNGSLGGGNYEQARRSLWDETLSPEMRRVASGLTRGLLIDFPGKWRVMVDKSDIQALQEQATEKATRSTTLFKGAGIMLDEYRAMNGFDPLPNNAGQVFMFIKGALLLGPADIETGALSGMDSLWSDGGGTLNEYRKAMGLDELKGGDVRQISIRSMEQTLDQLAEQQTPIKPPTVALAITGPTVDQVPADIEKIFPAGTFPDPNEEPPAEPTPPAGPLPPTHPPVGGIPPVTPPVVPLTEAKSRPHRLEVKTRKLTAKQQAFVDAIERVRQREIDEGAKELRSYFDRLASRAAGILGREQASQRNGLEVKVVTPLDLVPASEDSALAKILKSIALRTAQNIWDAINDTDVMGSEDFDESLPRVTQLLKAAAGRAIDINDVTRGQLREILADGYEAGRPVTDIAHGWTDDDGNEHAGVRSVVEQTYKNRDEAIARTETGFAQIGAQRARYAASGIEQVEIQDGDDDDVCGDRNDTVVDLDDEPDLAHPNCTLNLMPVIPEWGDEEAEE